MVTIKQNINRVERKEIMKEAIAYGTHWGIRLGGSLSRISASGFGVILTLLRSEYKMFDNKCSRDSIMEYKMVQWTTLAKKKCASKIWFSQRIFENLEAGPYEH
jgi:hypothetical protein